MTTPESRPSPPSLARRLLSRCCPTADRAFILADLDDEFQDLALQVGLPAARRWYRLQVIRSIGPLWLTRMRFPQPASESRHEMHLWSDLRMAVRLARRAPVPTAAVLLTIALATGAVTALFSVVNGIYLRPTAFPDGDRLVWLYTNDSRLPQTRGSSSPADVLDWQRQARSFVAMAFWNQTEFTIGASEEPSRVMGVLVTEGMDRVMGVRPALGRFFTPEEYATGARVAMLDHAYWRSAFGGDSGVIGRMILVNDRPAEVIGVLPPLRVPFPWNTASPVGTAQGAQVWLVQQVDEATVARQRGATFVRVVGRLRPGVSIQQAQAELQSIEASIARQFPAAAGERSARLEPLLDGLAGEAKPMLLLLAAAVILVLAIACANVCQILLARSQARRREFAIRLAIGGTAGRITRQLTVEALALAAVGGAGGLLLAPALLDLLLSRYPGVLARGDELVVDLRVLGVAIIVAAVAGLLAVLPVAHQARAPRLAAEIQNSERSGLSRRRQAIGRFLVAAQVAVAVVMLYGSGLLLRSLWVLSQRDVGFETIGRVTFNLAPSAARHPGPAELTFLTQARERLSLVPGVKRVATTSLLPYTVGNWQDATWREGVPQDGATAVFPLLQGVSGGYIEVMGMPILRGRSITDADGTAESRVTVINDKLARRLFGSDDPIGRRIGSERGWWEVVGVVKAKRHYSVRNDPEYEMMVPRAVSPNSGRATWYVVQSDGDPKALLPQLRAAVAELDPTVAFAHVATFEERVSASLAPDRFRGVLVGALAMIALVLTVTGIWGMVAHAVSRRTREIGIRIALGEAPGAVRARTVRDALRTSAIGIAAGVLVASPAGLALSRFLAGVGPVDPATFAGVILVFLGVTSLAALGPAGRASRVDPMSAIRAD